MTRFRLTIEYDGGPYLGWQRQIDQPTIQGTIEMAAQKLDGRPVTVFGAGRTDSGVHALRQSAHLDLVKKLPADKVRDGLNFHMGKAPISVIDACETGEDFHARFDAVRRDYLYRLIDRRPRLALDRERVWRLPVKMDVAAMHEAAQHLVGRHDFTTFRDKQCQANSPIKTLDQIEVVRVGPEIHLRTNARSFLHRQVRSITGTLADIGMGKIPPDMMKSILDARDRTRCGQVAPAHGLYLAGVHYPQ